MIAQNGNKKWATARWSCKLDAPFTCMDCNESLTVRKCTTTDDYFCHDKKGVCNKNEKSREEAAKAIFMDKLESWEIYERCDKEPTFYRGVMTKSTCINTTLRYSFTAKDHAKLENNIITIYDEKKEKKVCVHISDTKASEGITIKPDEILSKFKCGSWNIVVENSGSSCPYCMVECRVCRESCEESELDRGICGDCMGECPDCGDEMAVDMIEYWKRCRDCNNKKNRGYKMKY